MFVDFLLSCCDIAAIVCAAKLSRQSYITFTVRVSLEIINLYFNF